MVIEVIDISKKFRVYESKKKRIVQAIKMKRRNYCEEVNALRNINFTLEKGDSLAIIGKIKWKSTLLQIMAGTLAPSNGNMLRAGWLLY